MSKLEPYKGGPLSVINSEIYVISCMMMGVDSAIYTVTSWIDRSDIEKKELALIFDVVLYLYESMGTVDPVLVSNELKRRNELKTVESCMSINDLADYAVSEAHLEQHLKEVRNASASRKILNQAKMIQNSIEVHGDIDGAKLGVHEITKQLFRTNGSHCEDIKDVILRSWQEMSDYVDGKAPLKRKFNWKRHDAILGGLGPGNVLIVGARPGMGKTQYAVNIARNMGCSGLHVYIKSYEMPVMEIAERFIGMMSVDGVIISEEKKKRPEDVDLNGVQKVYDRAIEIVGSANISIDDNSRDGTLELRVKLKEMKARGLLDVCILDYLQLIPKSPKQAKSADPLGEISKEIKAIAKEVGIPIIALSQLNREAVKRSDKKPKLEDLRESGSIEQDADAVALLHRDDYYVEDAEDSGIMGIYIVKNRHGSKGVVEMYYDRSIGLMAEVDKWGSYEQ